MLLAHYFSYRFNGITTLETLYKNASLPITLKFNNGPVARDIRPTERTRPELARCTCHRFQQGSELGTCNRDPSSSL